MKGGEDEEKNGEEKRKEGEEKNRKETRVDESMNETIEIILINFILSISLYFSLNSLASPIEPNWTLSTGLSSRVLYKESFFPDMKRDGE